MYCRSAVRSPSVRSAVRQGEYGKGGTASCQQFGSVGSSRPTGSKKHGVRAGRAVPVTWKAATRFPATLCNPRPQPTVVFGAAHHPNLRQCLPQAVHTVPHPPTNNLLLSAPHIPPTLVGSFPSDPPSSLGLPTTPISASASRSTAHCAAASSTSGSPTPFIRSAPVWQETGVVRGGGPRRRCGAASPSASLRGRQQSGV